jgi:branched-chain amino acid transport system permease protein
MMERVVDPLATAARTKGVRSEAIAFLAMLVLLVLAPAVAYPVFLMKALCFALFACAFNLLIGYVGLLSFGHALYFGWAGYVSAHLAKIGSPCPTGPAAGTGSSSRCRRSRPNSRSSAGRPPPRCLG